MSLRPSSKTEVRRSRYKVAVDVEEGRRIREEEMAQVGKDRREEILQKKRSQPLAECQTQKQFLASVRSASRNYKKLEHLHDLVTGAWSHDGNMQLKAATEFRQLLSIGDEGWSSTIKAVTIKEVIKAGVVPRFVQFLSRDDFPQLQFEATWVLTNIASGTSEDTKVVIDNGAVPIFVKLLRSPSEHVREQAVWALGNVAGDSPATRDLVLSHMALPPLLAQLNVNENASMLRIVTWVLTNICRGKPHPPFKQVKAVLPALSRVMHSNDGEVLANICSILCCLCNGSNQIQAVIDAGLCPRLVKLLLYPHPVLYPALHTVKNIISGGNDMQLRYIIDLQVLPCFFYLLTTSNSKVIMMIVCYIISRLTSNKEFSQDVMEAGIFPPLLSLLRNAESKVKKLAALAITNAMLFGSNEQLKFFATEICVQPLCNLLSHSDSFIVMTCLNGIEAILKAGETEKKKLGSSEEKNPYAETVRDCEGLERMENLHDHENVAVYEKAVKILETYWPANEEDDTYCSPV